MEPFSEVIVALGIVAAAVQKLLVDGYDLPPQHGIRRGQHGGG